MSFMFTRIKNSAFWYSFLRDKVAVSSAVVVGILCLLALFAPWISPHTPYDIETLDIMNSQLPPSWQEGGDKLFLLGTDIQGRDILSTILYGMRISLVIGFIAVVLQAVLGTILGLIAGYFGGFIDAFLMRLADIQLSFSTAMVAITLLAIFQKLFGVALYTKICSIYYHLCDRYC